MSRVHFFFFCHHFSVNLQSFAENTSSFSLLLFNFFSNFSPSESCPRACCRWQLKQIAAPETSRRRAAANQAADPRDWSCWGMKSIPTKTAASPFRRTAVVASLSPFLCCTHLDVAMPDAAVGMLRLLLLLTSAPRFPLRHFFINDSTVIVHLLSGRHCFEWLHFYSLSLTYYSYLRPPTEMCLNHGLESTVISPVWIISTWKIAHVIAEWGLSCRSHDVALPAEDTKTLAEQRLSSYMHPLWC